MSVTDLVTEVEQAMVKGERLDKAGETYSNLKGEAARLRLDNDQLTREVEVLREARAKFVTQEEEITAKLKEEGGFSLYEADLVGAAERIREVDLRLAALRVKHIQNIRDVGELKRTMSRIETRGEVTTMVDRIEDGLLRGCALAQDGPEAEALSQLVNRLQSEFDRVSPKVVAYEKDIQELTATINNAELDLLRKRQTPSREADDARLTLVSHLKRSKRMIAQLARLHDIQALNAQEIGMLERTRAKLQRHAQIRGLLAAGDAGELAAKAAVLQKDTSVLRGAIQDIEAGLDAHVKESFDIIAKLRSMKDVLTPETGKLREQLIANIHQEEQWKSRLAVLRGEIVQNIRFIAMLSGAAAKK